MSFKDIVSFIIGVVAILLIIVIVHVVITVVVALQNPGQPKESRIELIETKTLDGNRMKILKDNESGILYLSYNGGLVKLESAPAAAP